MRYVYTLRCTEPEDRDEDRDYVGATEDLKGRMVPHTAKFRPWKLKTYVAFSDDAKAFAFEKIF